ncbi:phosphoribosylamine--glycine ligase [Listeria welshimeri]|uniref:Phosphoribosylamine--glycine ligase n=1 Tax=Listeria welshimeri serovar 6b (strain ATCC 35897 / DSM 20650 / CCUG 15529 / CIP 8149 / NCTC 11857 / SLCC 5334 / V8) TaxID=386043 RepID=A0AJL8_LISW6|nr:phosphoribosylamine--glycine ligase [Listeria welshimeri]MBC1589586.1 phosphoribosylamine--glycine ligase [Listeria welshimeri]MBF2468767.1 phosphoribosylamine--glycine ligase [Listeria welshimeri]MBF2687379.1 phosphoribosylamine--glycine ligase [Listeria welshimeri]CAK21200.1 phosphoribosylglycinamide synthetase [Listeria welshimeri serovar 6b str. SLCC5334]SNV25937.1 Phosphoribosylamine--glycine ligase [Listeria welshimeri]
MNLLVVGSGGREHAISKKLLESNNVEKVYCAPGNDGMRLDDIELVAISETDKAALIAFAKEKSIGFVIVGPEVPLLEGVVDALEEAGIKAFGPKANAALIEGSKDFAKQFMEKYAIPTAASRTFTDYEEAKAYLDERGVPIVIKADGLAAGKGVTVALEMEEAVLALKDMMLEEKFGDASLKVVIEDFLAGEEFSLMAFVNGEEVYPMAIAQDHKRAYEGDKGPNTGGMGAYSPVPHISETVVEEAVKNILRPAAKGMVNEGRYFRGILYAGLILTESGPKVIEFNARFGDPETQVVLPRLESDFAALIEALLNNEKPDVRFKKEGITLGVVLASAGYPEHYEKGNKLTGLADISNDVVIYHAGTKQNESGDFLSNGGRVLLLAKEAETMIRARTLLYPEMEKLDNPNFFYRMDIGTKAE